MQKDEEMGAAIATIKASRGSAASLLKAKGQPRRHGENLQ
jgi:hypothetical protein